MSRFDLTDTIPPPADGLVHDIAVAALDLAEQHGAPGDLVSDLRTLLRRAEAPIAVPRDQAPERWLTDGRR